MEVLTRKSKMGAPALEETLQDLCHRLLAMVRDKGKPEATGKFHLRNGVVYEITLRKT